MAAVRWWSALLVLLLAFCAANEALAQRRRTGGSFGGGSFGRRSSSSSTPPSTGPGGSSSSGSRLGSSAPSRGSRLGSGTRRAGSSSWGTSPSGGRTHGGSSTRPSRARRGGSGCGYGLGGGACCVLAFGGLVALLLVSRRKRSGGVGASSYGGADAMFTGELRLGIDWRARRDVQDTLRRLAETGDTQTAHGRALLLRETVLALRRAEVSWLYVSQTNHGPMAPEDAQGRFNQLAGGARATFSRELVRGAAGDVHIQAGPDGEPHPTQGAGVVVVSLIVAAYRPLPPMSEPDANQVRMALDNRAALTADQLAALEVVWSPDADDARMSTAELEQRYPDLRLIDPESIAGRIFCGFCRGPFAMELPSCPHCGAPAEQSRGNRGP